MKELFLQILNLSINASYLILAILFIRFILKSLPKKTRIFLWLLVGIRLICLFSIESMFSLIPSKKVVYITETVQPGLIIDTGNQQVSQTINQTIKNVAPSIAENSTVFDITTLLSIIWIIGIGLFFIYFISSVIQLKRKLKEAVLLKGNVYLCDHIDACFVFGIFHPNIYIPSSIDEKDIKYILAHERTHIERKDYVSKPIAFLLLSIHWFNPIVWIAYKCFCNDLELVCDEKVLLDLGLEYKKEYSNTLINYSDQTHLGICPLAFSENNVKSRVMSILEYKKPSNWFIVFGALICCLLIVFFMTSPKNKLENIEIDQNRIIHAYGDVPMGATDKGIYFVEDEILYYKENNKDVISLGYINYRDGEKKPYRSADKTRRDDFTGFELICYGDRIYMQYYTDEFGKNCYYQLASVDSKGEDFKTHIIFDNMPQDIKINNGKVYVSYIDFENNNQNYIEIYNQNFELESTEYYDQISNYYTENGELVVVEDNYVVYENDKIKITNEIEIISDDAYKGTGIIQIEDEQFIFDNKTVQFVTDKYFYVSSDTCPQTYERYHINGELDKSIVINDHIESTDGFISFPNSDFSYMQILKDEDVVYGYSNSINPKYFEVNFKTGTCNYINE